MDEKKALPRRGFVNGFLGAALAALAGAVIYPVLRFVSPPRIPEAVRDRVLAGTVGELSQKKWKLFPFGAEPGILLQTASGDYRAFAATCTHLECTVQYHGESKRLWCPCHNGWYDLGGRNVEGPPPAPLEAYTVELDGEDIFVRKA
jgi:Rieske Fe-S protein